MYKENYSCKPWKRNMFTNKLYKFKDIYAAVSNSD